MTPGADGKPMIEQAAAMPATTEVEKVLVQMLVADSAGDTEKSFTLAVKARDLAPTVVALNYGVATHAQALNKWDDAVAASKKATELDPKNGAAWNQLGYGYVFKKQWDDAVAAFRKYVEAQPGEANAHDSLADALLWSGKVDEAAAEYQKAIDAKMWLSNTGLATVQAIKGDWAGARASIDAFRDGATEPASKVDALYWKSAAFTAEGQLPEALKTVDQAEKEAAGAKLDFLATLGPIIRGDCYVMSGKHADALKQYALAEKAKLDAVGEGQKRRLAAWRLVGVTEAYARTGKTADAEKSLAALVELFKPVPGNIEGADQIARGRGLVAIGKKDFKGAVEALSKCTELADLCKVALAEAQEKAGDATSAAATRDALMKANHRDPGYWLARSVVGAAAAPGKKVAAEAPPAKK